MQNVSKKYRKSMKSPLRERGYIMVSFGLINQEAQAKASISRENTLDIAKFNLFQENKEKNSYAMFENNFIKTDGSMFFIPRNKQNTLNTDYISDGVINNPISIRININTHIKEFKGMTIDFGHNYPVNFNLEYGNNQRLEIRNNDKDVWVTEEVIRDTNYITLNILKMKNPNNRLRIYSIKFGYGLNYYNDSVINSSLNSFVSPICEALPQIDFTLELKNYDQYFNVDNPNSAIHFLETGQEMNVMYGYQLPNSNVIEWIKGARLECSEWESDDKKVVIKSQDFLRNLNKEYYKGTYHENGKSYYSLATEIFQEAGIENYYIDSRLKQMFTNNPLPKIKHKEALQIISNACRCSLLQTRDGKIKIISNFIPKTTISATDKTKYSNMASVLENENIIEYAFMDNDYIKLDGTMSFTPKSDSKIQKAGYVGNRNTRAIYSRPPIITLTMAGVRSYHGLRIVFGSVLPKKFIIKTYLENNLVQSFTIDDEIEQDMVVLQEIDDCNKITIEFIENRKERQRVVVKHLALNDVANLKMEKMDMLNATKSIKQELIKDVSVVIYDYQKNDKVESVISQDVDTKQGQESIIYINQPSYDYVLKSNSQSIADIVEYGSYYVKVRYKTTGKNKLEIDGKKYIITEKAITKTLNDKGKSIKWKNPLISNSAIAGELLEWLAEHFKSSVEYEYKTRGNPELDASDIVFQENDFKEKMKVNVYEYKFDFKQSFSGNIKARRIGG